MLAANYQRHQPKCVGLVHLRYWCILCMKFGFGVRLGLRLTKLLIVFHGYAPAYVSSELSTASARVCWASSFEVSVHQVHGVWLGLMLVQCLLFFHGYALAYVSSKLSTASAKVCWASSFEVLVHPLHEVWLWCSAWSEVDQVANSLSWLCSSLC